MKKLGLDYEQLRKRRPNIIMVSGSVYGQTGPLSQEWGIDGTGAALSSRIFMTGWPDREPVLPSVPYGDALLPLLMASACVAALDHRSRTGEGAHIDASMFEVQVQQMLPALIEQQLTQQPPKRAGNRSAFAAPHGVFPCTGEDRWIAVACEDDEQWRALANLMNLNDRRFDRFADRKQHEEQLEALVGAWTGSQDAYDLMVKLQSAGIAAGVVQNAGDVLDSDPQLKTRGFLEDVNHSVLGTFGHQAPPFKLSRTPAKVRAAPKLGEHTRQICIETLGMTAADVDRLTSAGVFA
jgi:benzylsuccinate CoA-transferase BbsF subunit